MPIAETGFVLHPRLAADSHRLGAFSLCGVRLMNDRRWPWLLLVPRRAGLAEWHELSEAQSDAAGREIRHASAALKQATGCGKINVAALGNVVAQLHIHVVARSAGDANWPGPVWGHGARIAYGEAERDALSAVIRQQLAATGEFRGDPI